MQSDTDAESRSGGMVRGQARTGEEPGRAFIREYGAGAVALITGCSSGIGRATAAALVAAGDRVVRQLYHPGSFPTSPAAL